MTNAPERIWVYAEKFGWRAEIMARPSQSDSGHRTPYTRTDLCDAAIARAEKAERKLALREICAIGDELATFEENKALRAQVSALVEAGNNLRAFAMLFTDDAPQVALREWDNAKGTPNAD